MTAPVNNNTLSLYSNGASKRLELADDAEIYRDGELTEADALQVGDEIFVRLQRQEVVFVQVTEKAEEEYEAQAIVSAAATSELLTVRRDNMTLQYPLREDAAIVRGTEEIAAEDLKVGDKIVFRVTDGEVEYVQVSEAAQENGSFTGTLRSPVGEDRKLELEKDGVTLVYKLAKNAVIYREGEIVRASRLMEGDLLFIHVDGDEAVFVQVLQPVEDEDGTFQVEGRFHSMTVNADGQLSSVTIVQSVKGGEQQSIYSVAEDVTIKGDPHKLVKNQPVRLIGDEQQVHTIEIQ